MMKIQASSDVLFYFSIFVKLNFFQLPESFHMLDCWYSLCQQTAKSVGAEERSEFTPVLRQMEAYIHIRIAEEKSLRKG